MTNRSKRIFGALVALGLALALAGCEQITLKKDVVAQVASYTTPASGTSSGLSAPTISPGTGSYSSDQTVFITTGEAGGVIHYTTDGTTPTANSPSYSTSFLVTGTGTTETIKAIVVVGTTVSSVAVAVIAINYTQVSTPVITPGTGTYTTDQTVTITCGTTGASIYYTTDGSTPTSASTLYTGTGFVVAGTGTVKTIKAIAMKATMANSTVASSTITIAYPQLGPLVFSPVAATYDVDQLIVVTPSAPAPASGTTTVFYTLDGATTPTTASSSVINGQSPAQRIGIYGPGATTVKAFATYAGYLPSTISSVNYTISYPANGKIETVAGISPAAKALGSLSFGLVNGQGAAARFYNPQGVVADSSGNLYVADTGNNLIRKIDSTGTVTTLAGGGTATSIGLADGTGTGATFSGPAGLAINSAGTLLYVADAGFHAVRKVVTATGQVTTLQSANWGSPTGVAVDSTGYVYVADAYDQGIVTVTPSRSEYSTATGIPSHRRVGLGGAVQGRC